MGTAVIVALIEDFFSSSELESESELDSLRVTFDGGAVFGGFL